MKGIRVAMVTRRFWPLTGNKERTWANLAQELLSLGHSPVVITARFDGRWPSEVVFRELPVHRLPFPRRFGWGTMRYMIALSRWLRRNQSDIDLVYVSDLSLEAYAAIGAMEENGIPVVLRASETKSWEEDSGSFRRRHLNQRVIRRCQTAAAFITPYQATLETLHQSDFPEDRLHWIPDGVTAAALTSLSTQTEARLALTKVNADLRVPSEGPVVTYIGPLSPQHGLENLIVAWRQVALSFPNARLWLIGDGSLRTRLYRLIRDHDLLGRVLMPGIFDDLEDIILASDMLVMPSAHGDHEQVILEAMATRLPVLVVDDSSSDNLVQAGVTGRIINGNDSASLSQAITTALADPAMGSVMADQAYRHVQENRPLRETAWRHQRLFEDIIRASKRLIP